MLNPALKRFVLPFAPKKDMEPFGSEVELASIYALAETQRAKGSGLFVKQPQEKLYFIVQAGYPLCLYPHNDMAHIFDGLNNSSYTMAFAELSTAKAFIESFEEHSKTKEEYLTFLNDHQNYFRQTHKERQVPLRGLIANAEFKKELIQYRKEAIETSNPNLVALTPTLEEPTIAATLTELNKTQLAFKEDTDKLPECLRLINKTTNQYATGIEYAAQAAKEEANAKIKAREELVNPQIAELNKTYKHNLAKLIRSFDDEIESLQKQKSKTEKTIQSSEEKVRQYEHEAQTQAKKNHVVYARRWREKRKKTRKELDGLKKEYKRLEGRIRELSNQKNRQALELSAKLDIDIKAARQPIVDLETLRDAKTLEFKQQIQKLQNAEKPVVDMLYSAIKEREGINAKFEELGIKDPTLKNFALFYVPFYVVCYTAGLSRRYVFVPPSTSNSIGFSSKLKGVFGISRIKEMFTPRFQAVSALIEGCQSLVKGDIRFEDELGRLGEKNNLLRMQAAVGSIAKGLVYLEHEGWLSQREYEALSGRLTHA